MDSFASLALATDPPTDEHLNRPPYKKTEFIIEKRMWKHIVGQGVVQIILLFIMMYAGEWFLPEFGSGTRVKYNEDTDCVRSGRIYHPDGSEDYKEYSDDPDIGPSRHFTYIFNVFVLLQLTNEINSRKLRDEINAFSGILRNKMFIGIWFFTFFMQVLIVSVGSYAFSCHVDGLTVEQWFICLAFSVISIGWRFVLLLIPSKVFPQVGMENHDQPSLMMSLVSSTHNRDRYSLTK
jgi:Ca2+ transporting ATPase